ncbi:DUF2659 family protein [Candidatus Tisiphia endosymbiont of Nemotelus uliginosus]|uniref:DUF2659 family protein n=1 Tax=Candidatus Tisiphia endosymbiont of Nemotelus uliginosus TaxID=3077926 RepID=UPI0035C8FE47
MTDILEEILNDHKEQKRLYYFRKLLPIVIVFVVITVIIMGINNWYNDKAIRNNQEMGDILVKNMASTNGELTIKTLEQLVAMSNNKIQELAVIEQIGLEIKRNNWPQVDNLLHNAINNKHYDELTTAYARLIWISLNIDKISLSDIHIKELEEHLNYFNNIDKPFYGTANLLKAHWYIKRGAEGLAVNILTSLISLEELTLSIKEQANALLALLTTIK